MDKNRITTLHALLDNCIVPISVTLCRKLRIEEIFAAVVYQKKHQCDDLQIGFRMVSAHSDGLVYFLPKYCIDVQMINNCNLIFERENFFLLLIGEVKNHNFFGPLAFY